MAFWGVAVAPGRPVPFVPSLDAGNTKLHLSQACLVADAPSGAKAGLAVKVGDGEPLMVCSLREGSAENCGLDLIIDGYAEFSVVGSAAIHLTGYFMPEYEIEGGSEGEDDDEDGGPYGQILGYDDEGNPVLAGEYDSEEDSDYEMDSDDEDAGAMLLSPDAFANDEEGSSEEETEEESDEEERPRGRRDVIIEEITEDQGHQKQKQDGKAANAPAQKAGKQQASAVKAEFADDDVEASDEEEEEEEEEEESEEDEEEDSDEEAAAAAAAAAKAKAGEKRKAEQAVAKQPAAKAAKAEAAQQPQQQQKEGKAAKQQNEQQQKGKEKKKDKEKEGKAKVREFPNGFVIEELKQGPAGGKLAKGGRKVVVRYVGRLKSNGKIFDQTLGNKTFSFRLGVGEVIKGWDRGVEGMRVGDKRRLTIPPKMGYGASGVRNAIPGNSTLLFEVELVDVK